MRFQWSYLFRGPRSSNLIFYQMHVCLFKAALERKLLSQFPPTHNKHPNKAYIDAPPYSKIQNGQEVFMPSAESSSGIHMCCFYFNISKHYRINLNYHFFIRKHMKRLVPCASSWNVPFLCDRYGTYTM